MKHYKTGEFARLIGVSNSTLFNWDKNGILKAYRSPTNRRYYTQEQLDEYNKNIKITEITDDKERGNVNG